MPTEPAHAPVALLRRTVAAYLDVPEDAVGPGYSLRALPDSVSRAGLDAAIRKRVGRASKAVYSATTVGEIEAELFGGTAPAAASATTVAATPTPRAFPSAGKGVSCGIDLELADNLPAAADYWEEPFYRQTFTAAEIAYCLRRDDPGPHFAARWAAKEAFKKCEPSALGLEMNRIEVVLDDAGAPSLSLVGEGPDATTTPLGHSLSLSHTGPFAVAVVVSGPPPAPAVASPPPPPPPPAPSPPPPRRGGKLGFLIQLATLATAAFALYRTYAGHP